MGPHAIYGCGLCISPGVIDDSWNASVGRRDFLRSLAGIFALTIMPDGESDSLTIGILPEKSPDAFRAGVRLGLTEARRTASLFHRKPLETVNVSTAQVVIGMSEFEPHSDAVYLNCGARSDAYRANCIPNVFHIEASDSMYAQSARLANGRIELWSSELERYGAAQLNDRFAAATHLSMNGLAWAGWFAVKVVWESMLQMKGKGAGGLKEYLLKSSTQFDGHKGAPLSFRESDHQLRQPLYAVTTGKPPQDVPDAARATGSMRDELDSIIPPSSCKR